jgi:hypothetical protein
VTLEAGVQPLVYDPGDLYLNRVMQNLHRDVKNLGHFFNLHHLLGLFFWSKVM